MKTYRMSIDRVFPATHERAGEETYFYPEIQNALFPGTKDAMNDGMRKKYHIIRANYEFWKKRIDEVNAGKAELMLYEWTGKPYRSKTKNLLLFNKHFGIGIQKIMFYDSPEYFTIENAKKTVSIEELSKNDGLFEYDFLNWFIKYDLSKPMAIIQFTDYFRY